MQLPIGGKRINDINEYKTNVKDLTHVAVWRGTLKISHHYLVLSVSSNCVVIIHYTGGKNASKALSVARITQQDLEYHDKNSDLLDFEAGVFFIYRADYPSTKDEELAASKRALSRVGETKYSVSINNCESFVTWALTGISRCEQFEKGGTGKRILADSVDGLMESGKRMVHGAASDATSPAIGIGITKTAIIKSSGVSLVSTAVKTGAKTAARAAGISIGISAAVAVPIEATLCGWDIYNLRKQRKLEYIDKKAFKRQVTKKVSSSASSVVASTGLGFLGMFVGQIIFPIPLVGGIIGGAVGGIVGSVVGRTTGSAVSGKVFDAVTN